MFASGVGVMKRNVRRGLLLVLATAMAAVWHSVNSYLEALAEDRYCVSCWPSHTGLKDWKDSAFDGAWAPRGFKHGTCWVTGYKPTIDGRKRTIRTVAIQDDTDKVTVYVLVDGKLSGVYDGEKREGSFPGITKGTDPRRPTEYDRRAYKLLAEQIEKPNLIKGGESQGLFRMPSLSDK